MFWQDREKFSWAAATIVIRVVRKTRERISGVDCGSGSNYKKREERGGELIVLR
jgi:hypothetical protein